MGRCLIILSNSLETFLKSTSASLVFEVLEFLFEFDCPVGWEPVVWRFSCQDEQINAGNKRIEKASLKQAPFEPLMIKFEILYILELDTSISHDILFSEHLEDQI